jgi:hypothetical protein
MASGVRLALFLAGFLTGGASGADRQPSDFELQWEKVPWPRDQLNADAAWALNPPDGERFDASALLLRPGGELLTLNDRGPNLYRIQFSSAKSNEADLVRMPDWILPAQLAPFATEKIGRWDCEGLAEDSHRRIYMCEEANRWIVRFDPRAKTLERLNIDWSPAQKYFHKTDHNASFEGIATGKGKLYVANERQAGRILVVHLQSGKVIDDFTVRPSRTRARDIHYSDLCWFDNALFALLRENRVVVKIDPKRHTILAEYDFREMERRTEYAYETVFPTSTFEGLAVDADSIWLVTDNNGESRRANKNDRRPTLFRCRRPEAAAKAKPLPGTGEQRRGFVKGLR